MVAKLSTNTTYTTRYIPNASLVEHQRSQNTQIVTIPHCQPRRKPSHDCHLPLTKATPGEILPAASATPSTITATVLAPPPVPQRNVQHPLSCSSPVFRHTLNDTSLIATWVISCDHDCTPRGLIDVRKSTNQYQTGGRHRGHKEPTNCSSSTCLTILPQASGPSHLLTAPRLLIDFADISLVRRKTRI